MRTEAQKAARRVASSTPEYRAMQRATQLGRVLSPHPLDRYTDDAEYRAMLKRRAKFA